MSPRRIRVWSASGVKSARPGDGGPGILTCSNLNAGITASGVLRMELNDTTPGSGYDQLNVHLLASIDSLDDCGSFGSVLLEAARHFEIRGAKDCWMPKRWDSPWFSS